MQPPRATEQGLGMHGINLYETVDSGSLSYYASFPANEINYLKNSGIVKWLGLIPKNGKINNNLFNYILQNPDETVINYIIVFPDIDETLMRTKLQEFVEILDYSPEGHFYLVSSNGKKLQQILDLEFVKQIEEWRQSVITNVHGLPAVGGDTVLGLGSYNGSGVNIELTDTGIAYSGGSYHPDLPVPIDQWDYSGSGDSIADDQNGHGTHTAGTALGRGNRNSLYTGVAPGASLIAYKWVVPNVSTPFADVMTRAAQHTTDVSSNSWGYYPSNGIYLTYGSGVVDTAVLGQYNNKKISVVVAAGNNNNLVADPGTNKNGITVGAATAGNDDNRQYSWSSGCTDDAEPAATNACFSNFGLINYRLKPDVMAHGYMIISSYPWYLNNCNVNGDNYYCKESGTSMAAPNVAGIVAVMMQSQPILKNWPEGVKAQIINSAVYINSVPQIRQGHGHVSEFFAVYDQPGIFERPLLSLDNISGPRGTFKEYTFNVPAGFKEVKVTLVYSDNAGSATTQDLDLYVYNESGAQVGSSISGTDTVEELKFTSGTPGTWKARAQIYSTTRTVNYSIIASVRGQDPALSLSDFASTSVQPGSSFSLTTTLGNNGYVTVGSYIAMQQPSGFTLNDVDVYRNDGKIVNIPKSMLYYDSTNNSYRVSAGEVVNGYNRKVVWKFAAPGPLGTYIFNSYYGAQNFAQAQVGVSVNVTNMRAPSITSFAPPSPVNDTQGSSRTFNITVNQTVNVTWYINGTQISSNTKVTAANYTNTSAKAGIWNVTAIANNTNGAVSQIWTWNVIAPSYIPPAPVNLTSTQGNFWINYTWKAGAGNVTDGYIVSVNGTWINGTDLAYSNGTVPPHGWRNITIFAYNNSGSVSSPVTDTAQVANNIPVLDPIENKTVLVGQFLNFTVHAADADSDPVTYGMNADRGTLNALTGDFSWKPNSSDVGIYIWEFNSSDGYGGVAARAVTVTVNSAPVPPAIIGYAPPSPVSDSQGAMRVFNLTVNQTVNVTWFLNGTQVGFNESVTRANYTNASASPGTWNVSAAAVNANGSAMQTWIWTVSNPTPAPVIYFIDPTPVDGATLTQNYAYINTTVSDSSNTTAFIDWNRSLVGWWRFNGESGENSTFFRDWSSWGNNGTCSVATCPTLTSGMFGTALSFDGVNKYINVANSPSLNITDAITVEAWIYPRSDFVGYAAHPIGKWSSTTNANFVLYYFGTTSGMNRTVKFYANRGGIWGDISAGYKVDLNKWYHIVLSYNSTRGGQLYINGAAVGSLTGSGPLAVNAQPLKIGGTQGSDTINGTIDEVRIQNRALNSDEVKASYNAGIYRLSRNFTNLADGIYNYRAYVENSYGLLNSTEARTLNISGTIPP